LKRREKKGDKRRRKRRQGKDNREKTTAGVEDIKGNLSKRLTKELGKGKRLEHPVLHRGKLERRKDSDTHRERLWG